MGCGRSRINDLPLPYVIKQLSECDIPDDRNQAMDYIDQIDALLADEKERVINMKQLKKLDGVKVIIRQTKKLTDDMNCITAFAQILESINKDVPLMMDFIQFGGLDLITKAATVHARDNYLAMQLPKLARIILAVGAASSIQEIEQEAVNLTLCHCCQKTIEMSRSKLGSNAKIEIPTPADRINRVLRFMDNYLPRIDVQIAALNAVINFAKNADAPTTTKHTDIVNIVAKAFIQHIEVKEVVWRSCVAFATLASYSSEIALEIILTNAHEVAIDQFFKYDVEPVVQQQVLWLLASLLEWPRSKRVLHKSVKCMDFLKKMFALEEEKKLAVMNEVKNEAPQPSKKGNNNTIKVKALKFNLTTNTEAKELDPEINDQLKSNITTIIPLIIRTFYRESEGKTYEELKMAEKMQSAVPAKKRKNYDGEPKFGTVKDIYKKGEDGLLAETAEEEEQIRVDQMPDWEKKLTFSEDFDGIKKGNKDKNKGKQKP